MTEETGLQVAPAAIEGALSVKSVTEQVQLIQQIMKDAMKDKEHYGTIPGCGDKKVLLKAGAEKLNLTFRLDPEFDIDVIDIADAGHREYRIKCTIRSIVSGVVLGSGVGSCTTMEKKYRFTTGPKESTDQLVPKEYWNLRNSDPVAALEIIGGKGYSVAKVDGVWMIVIQGERVENENPADFWNTCLKMAKKRAMVDAVLTVTAASDIFTQDLEENVEEPVKPAAGAKSASPASGKPDVQVPEEQGDEASQIAAMLDEMGSSTKQREAFNRMMGEAGLKSTLAAVTAKYKDFRAGQAK